MEAGETGEVGPGGPGAVAGAGDATDADHGIRDPDLVGVLELRELEVGLGGGEPRPVSVLEQPAAEHAGKTPRGGGRGEQPPAADDPEVCDRGLEHPAGGGHGKGPMHRGGQDATAVNMVGLQVVQNVIASMREFVDQVYVPDTLAIASFYKDWGAQGEGLGNFMTYGDFPAHDGLWEMAEKTKDDLGMDGIGPGCQSLGRVASPQPLIGRDGKVRQGLESK